MGAPGPRVFYTWRSPLARARLFTSAPAYILPWFWDVLCGINRLINGCVINYCVLITFATGCSHGANATETRQIQPLPRLLHFVYAK